VADHEIRRWALGLPSWIGRAATLALLALLLSLVLFGSWVAVHTRATSQRAQAATSLDAAFQSAKFAIEQEEALQLNYRLSPSAEVRLEHHQAGEALVAALAAAEVGGDAVDQSAIGVIRDDHAIYLKMTKRLFDAVDAGDFTLAAAIDTGEIVAVFPPMEAMINREAVEHSSESAAALKEQQALADGTLQVFPVVLALGLLLVAFLSLVLEVNRRARNAKSTFFAKVSHELRTPLNSILGFGQLLVMTQGATLNEKQRRYVDNMISSGTHLLGLINDVLDMSKVEAGKMVVELTRVSVDQVLAATLEEVAPLIDAKSLDLQPLAGTRGLTIAADPMRLRQVLLNGLSNAIKFTEAEGSIHIATRSLNGAAWIEITDSGIGVPANQLARMFGEFEQVTGSARKLGEGTGLGLPLSRGLVEMMGGSLWLTSSEGQGTTFHVRLPLAANSTVPSPHTGPGTTPAGRNGREALLNVAS
jgi:signal transduction histidine kinase